MADPKELTRLIQQLQRVSSPLQRAKMLSRAWRSLRRLSPAQRQALADQVGIADGADLIEKLAVRKGGVNPSVVQRALEAVGDTNVGDLRRVIRDLRDPERRKTMVQKGFDAVTGSLAGPENDETRDEQPEPEVEPELPVAEPTGKAPIAVAVAAAGATTAATVVSKVVTDPEERPERSAPLPAKEPVRSPAPVVTHPTPAPTPKPTPAPKPPARPPAPAPAPTPTGISLLDRVGAETMISRRFRVFRENLDDARGLNAAQLRELLDLFPSGWGQRRVLCMLFERGIPGSVNKAVFLIEHLDSTLARRWCVKTLLGSRPLSAKEREALVERHAVFRVAADTR